LNDSAANLAARGLQCDAKTNKMPHAFVSANAAEPPRLPHSLKVLFPISVTAVLCSHASAKRTKSPPRARLSRRAVAHCHASYGRSALCPFGDLSLRPFR
jgi:hypothetical protein